MSAGGPLRSRFPSCQRDPGPPPLPPGAELAPGYRVVGLLRRGRDLDVYDLWSERRACRCVGKTVRSDRLKNRDARARVLREGRLLLRLTHPHIVRAYEVVTTPLPLVVLETLPGETLGHLIERHRKGLGVQELAHLGLHLCSAMRYLHGHGILHLDLKPSNIIATHGMAKVIDLSVARIPGSHRGGIGTPGYMAPEQSCGGVLDTATDVWGIGATLYEVATRSPVCDLGDVTSSRRARTIPCRPNPVRRRQRLPTALAMTIDRCLSVVHADRPAIAELTTSLEAVVREEHDKPLPVPSQRA